MLPVSLNERLPFVGILFSSSLSIYYSIMLGLRILLSINPYYYNSQSIIQSRIVYKLSKKSISQLLYQTLLLLTIPTRRNQSSTYNIILYRIHSLYRAKQITSARVSSPFYLRLGSYLDPPSLFRRARMPLLERPFLFYSSLTALFRLAR